MVGNAIKFTEQGKVAIAVRFDTTKINPLSIEVRDDGIGIEADMLEHIFRAFQQVDATSGRRFQGTGLGLAITDHFVRLMGGQILVRSTPGKGSTFTIHLPLKAAQSDHDYPTEHVQRSQDDNWPHSSLAGLHLLIAEDNATNRLVLQKVLSSTGATTVFCEDGQKAMDAFCSDSFDLVLMDMSMPVMNGETSAMKIRNYEEANGLERCPIVALTANALEADRERCRAVGMDGFLTKPIRKADLINGIREATRQSSSVQSNDENAQSPTASVKQSNA